MNMAYQAGSVELCFFDDGVTVFNSKSGETFRVSLLAAEILTMLENESRMTVDELCDRFSDVLASVDQNERYSFVVEAISRMEALDLVVPVVI